MIKPSYCAYTIEDHKKENFAPSIAKYPNTDKDRVSYATYLQLEKLLDCQNLRSAGPVHDEHLFIVIHQTYELWFKQLLYELDSIIQLFQKEYVEECAMLTILETMTPFEFNEFREFLTPASGFQKNRLGLRPINRVHYNREEYWCPFSSTEADSIRSSETLNLFNLVEH
ncbi:tryptophan 2,3-dioxygenase-like [Zophobas morio]|uniref:tryptophan 2,3-dioxygenase-like n=1 Tax=Zophobas morio TaxID=2755281 RepID=UPI003083E557